jgi:hypothetical protein
MDNDTKKGIIETKKALAVLYTLLKMKPKERERVISSVRKVHETDPYSDLPGELDITPAHIDPAVLYSIEDILYPKKMKTSSKKMN